ncbi:uncharacterized protein LOC111708917 [Eurytemora carolleeae]|uniref:uncharacterized protein LOC111708917 n=1 Tax=Eurytemora carolleeae TaxID=1294199 RepID=UPI000C761C5F|nr:uncharacterized protein LOC111708917 [Eurytemora carolleeae]|eukprot:XP_023338189.1 uncharacterized protein LOC111708917 [Eurytemora affinis]
MRFPDIDPDIQYLKTLLKHQKSISLPTRLDRQDTTELNGFTIHNYPATRRKTDKKYWKRYIGPALASIFAVSATLMVTSSVLLWNYTETVQRRNTKKQSLILDHWGKGGPLTVDSSILEQGEIVEGEKDLLRRDMGFPGADPKLSLETQGFLKNESQEKT